MTTNISLSDIALTLQISGLKLQPNCHIEEYNNQDPVCRILKNSGVKTHKLSGNRKI